MESKAEFPSTLAGVKVLDFSHVQSGPICTVMLADMGAEVVKIEPFIGDQFRESMEGANFFNFNRNKRAMALNLKTQEGKEIVLKLAKKSDVLVENFLPGSLAKLGLGYEAISRLNPSIIYCSISGFGQGGPFRHRPAYEPVLQAMSGIMDSTGEADRPPVRIRPAMAPRRQLHQTRLPPLRQKRTPPSAPPRHRKTPRPRRKRLQQCRFPPHARKPRAIALPPSKYRRSPSALACNSRPSQSRL